MGEYQQEQTWCIDYEELMNPEFIRKRHHDRGMTCAEIAEEVGCSVSQVHKRLRQYDIEPQREKYVELADPKWLKKHNHDKEMRLYEMANLIGCTRSAIGFAMKRHGLEVKRHHSNPTGEDSPFWEEGYNHYYGPNWQEKREQARQRDGYKCQDCGVSEQSLEIPLHVHHINPLKNFDDIEEANRLENLVSLCQPCHNRWEGIPLKPDNR
jgi:5-methylcytosine-specific restriction endonuclease McrA